jgi:hypothetical protein
VRTLYQSKRSGLGCLGVHAPPSVFEGTEINTETSSWSWSAMPAALKVKGSVMARLFDVDQADSPIYGITAPAKSAARNHLQIEFSMGALASKSARLVIISRRRFLLLIVVVAAT